MVRDSEDRARLVAESSSQASRFPTPRSLTGSAHNSEEESDHQEVIKSESQSDTEEYQDPRSVHSDIDSTNPRSPSHPQSPTNIATSKRGPKRPSSFDDMSVSHALTKATEIKPLNGPEDWVEWNRKLRGTLGLAGLWKVLTGESAKPTDQDTDKLAIWEENQEKLESLLILICGPIALSHIEKDATKNATEQYEILKKEFDSHTVTTYSLLYRQIFKCSIANHKTLQEYGEAVTKARNKLVELGNPLPELAVTCAFLDGLDTSYQAWKDMYLGGYSKDGVDKDGKIIISTIEEMLKLLIDRGSSSKVSAILESIARAFKAFQENSKKPKEKRSSSKGEEKECTNCLSNNHNNFSCRYKHPELATENFRQRYPTSEKIKAALAELRNKMSEWHKAHQKKEMKVNICANVTATGKKKDHQWYMDTAAAVHMTHDPCLYINADLDPVHERFETADDHKIQTQGAGTIALETLLDDKSAYVHLHNVYYFPELDSNLLSLGILEKKGFQFVGKQGFLYVIDNEGDKVLQAKREGTVYPLVRSVVDQDTTLPSYPIYKTSKPVTQEKWHQQAAHLNYRDLATLPRVTEGVIFSNESNHVDKNESQFCEAYTQGKQHKIHNKEPAINRATEAGVRLYADLF